MNTVRIGALELATPLMLSPMAGVTNPPFRQLCREQAEAGIVAAGRDVPRPAPDKPSGTFAPAGLWVCEMVTTRALIERRPKTMNMIQPDPRDPVRSIQLYGVSPRVTAEAIRILIEEEWADHIDLNFGCPAPKVTRRGGGSALPWKLDLFREIIQASIEAARTASATSRDFEIPVTAKIRLGIDESHETWKDAARIAEDMGVSALTLHARTTSQYYSGRAAWQAIGELVNMVDIPVFGNGDVFDVADARELMERTGCAGVAIGRGAQGRPWIFYNLAAWMHGVDAHAQPTLGEVCEMILRHGELAAEHYNDEIKAMREMRGHIASYLRGFQLGGQARDGFSRISTLEELRERLGELDSSQPYPEAADGRRGRAGKPKRPHLPEDWLDSRELTEKQRAKITSAEIDVSGG